MIETRDIWLASYLVLNKYKLVKTEILDRGRAKFFFEIDREKYEALKLVFFQSEISKIKQIQQNLKDLSY